MIKKKIKINRWHERRELRTIEIFTYTYTLSVPDNRIKANGYNQNSVSHLATCIGTCYKFVTFSNIHLSLHFK